MADPSWLYPVLGTAAVGIFNSVLAYGSMSHGWFADVDKPFGIGALLFIIIWIVAYIFIVIAWWSMLSKAPANQAQSINNNFTFLLILVLLLHLVLFGACSFIGALMVVAFVIIFAMIIAVQGVVMGNVASSILMALVLIWSVIMTMVLARFTTLNQ